MITVTDVSMVLAAGGHSVTILDRINFEIPAKQTVAIVGPSGSGKSTLLGLMAGLDRPSTGSIHLDGTDITTMAESRMARFRREKVGYIFQSFHLIPTLTAIENVAVPLELSGERRAGDRAADLLSAVGLSDRMGHYPVQLSGGEQQRVAVARAFACRPPILLADEPTGNLDSATGSHIVDLLLALHRDHGTTLVLVTHDTTLASGMQRVLSLRDGRLESDNMPSNSSFVDDMSTDSGKSNRLPSTESSFQFGS
ncbi:MAG: ABC transporter ATP-binding protein [Nitrospira sp.]|nr:ABC transporter ATP-binding protein [Nitrospira sp.]